MPEWQDMAGPSERVFHAWLLAVRKFCMPRHTSNPLFPPPLPPPSPFRPSTHVPALEEASTSQRLEEQACRPLRRREHLSEGHLANKGRLKLQSCKGSHPANRAPVQALA